MSLSDQVLLMRQSLDNVERELKSLEAGTKASAPRARKNLQALKQSSHALRKQITENVKTMPTKKRVKKQPVAEPMVVDTPEPESVVGPEPTTNVKPKARSKSKK